MTFLAVTALILLIAVIIIILYLLGQINSLKAKIPGDITTNMALMNGKLTEIEQSTIKLFGDIRQKVGSIDEKATNLERVQGSIDKLEAIFQNPKSRGNFGEFFLEEIVGDILPEESYKFQYTLQSRDIVDAVIFTSGKILPVDAKFPLENFLKWQENGREFLSKFKRDVKNRIEEISGKYIKPQAGTTDFALMYIPSESIYYKIVDEIPELIKFAREQHVIMLSPQLFAAYLSILLSMIKREKVAEKIKEVINYLNSLEEAIGQLSTNLATAYRHFSNGMAQLENLKKNIDRLESEIKSRSLSEK